MSIKTEMTEGENKLPADMFEVIRFTEEVSAKLHRVLDEAKIYQVVREEFTKSDRYTVGILLLDGDGTSLKLAETSMAPSKLKVLEKASGMQVQDFAIKLSKSSICRQVLREGKTVHTILGDVIREFLPRPLAYLITKTMGYDKQSGILTSLHRRGKAIGILVVSCADLCEYLIHSVENLALHISTALELADEHAQRMRAVQALERYHDHLGELVEERTAELKTVNEKLLEEITERKQAAEALRESREKFQKMFESVTDGISVIDLKGVIIETNPRAMKMHGFASRDELLGKNALELVAPRDRERIAANMRRAIKEGVIRGAEYTLLKADGSEFPGELSTSILKDAVGKRVGHITIARDITKRKQAEEKLRESEERFRSIVENSQAGIIILDDAYRFVYGNDELCRISGYSRDEIMGQDFRQFLDEESKQLVAERYSRRQKGEEVPSRYEFNIVQKDGQKRRVEVSSAVIKDSAEEVKTVAQILDITERKQAEEALQAEKNKLQSLVDAMEYGLTIQDKDYNIIYEGKLVETIFGDHRGEKCYRVYEGRERICEGCPVEKAFKDGESHTSERRVVMPSGEVNFWENTANPIRDANGEIVSCLEIVRNITERKQAEEALRDEATRRRILVDQSLDGIVVLDENAKVYEANQRFAEMLGYTPEEVRELHTWDWDKQFPPEKLLEMGRAVDEKGLRLETKHHRKDGSVIDVDISINAAVCSGQKLIFCVCRDVTERKQAEEALQAEKNKLQSLIDAIEYGLTIQDMEYNIIYEGTLQKKVFGDHLGEKCYRVYEGQEKICDGCPVEKAFKDGKSHTSERRVVMPSGEVLFWENTANPIRDANGGIVSCLEITRNITERKQAEEQLRESQKFSSSLLESSPNPISVVDLDTSIRYVNPAFEKLTGFTLAEIAGRKAPYPWWPEGKRERILAAFKDAVEHGGRRTERNFQNKNGEHFWVALNSAPVMEGGKAVYLIISWLDITERKQAEEQLQESEDYWKTLFDASTGGILIIEPETHKIVDANPAMVRMIGIGREEIIGRVCHKFVCPQEEGKCPITDLKQRVDTKECILLNASGEEVPALKSVVPITRYGRQYLLELIFDITERKQAEEKEKQLQQELYLAQRLASVGELAAGVAHEINNPLTGILGFSQRLIRQSTDEKVSRDLEIIYSEAQRAAEVVQSLLTFARRRQPKKEYANINDIVSKTLELRAYALQTGNIEVATTLASRLPQIMVDFPQMQEVFLNIILNAEQAMSEAHGRGKLVIKTKRIKDYLRISFADDGPGIPPENLDKVFDPFFTTREEKGGTGLGLSACHGVVTEHGGRIYATSKRGKGATFFVELPLSPVEAALAR
jgi:PAS domain S-box-containing protein